MATISTDTFLDDGTARTAGETWTINGCKLTIRTDTRWHADAPASMTGSLGSCTVSTALGGSINVDATQVRWMAFDTGLGTVPAIGTSITQGGVSGYLLGVWADYQSAPTAVGGVMPVSGFLKFREVTGGAFSTGALSGILANASSPDVTGWIEIARDTNSNFAGYELGDGVVFQGGWFELGTTSGSRGQILSVPTNGGGSGTHVFAVQIETSAGSGVYEWYPTAGVSVGASNWSAANFALDARSKFVESMGNGQIRIGSNGTVDIAYLPESGCKVRIPNILGRTVATASRATNQVPGAVTRANLSGGNYTIDGLHCDFLVSASGSVSKPYFHNFVCEQKLTLADNKVPVDIDNVCLGGFTSPANILCQLDRITGGTISNLKLVNQAYILGNIQFNTVDSVTYNNLEIICAKPRTSTAIANRIGSLMTNCVFNGLKLKGTGYFALNQCSNITVNDIDYIDRLEGNTTSANSTSVIQLGSSSNITIDGLSFGENGTITNTNCYGAIFASGQTPNNNVKYRNVGTRTNPIDCGTSIGTTGPASFINWTIGDSNFKVQRCYGTGIRSNFFLSNTSNMPGFLYEDVFFGYNITFTPNGYNPIIRKAGSAGFNTAPSANIGVHWIDFFTSDTTGGLRWFGSGPSESSAANNYLVTTANQGTGYITGSCAISLDTQDDYAYSEVDYWIKGHTGFQNVNPTLTGNTAGLVVYYDLDTGSGFTGNWTQATGANLSAETISPTGFKIKLKIVQQSTGQTTSALSGVLIQTTSTLAAQTDNQYPLDTVTLGFEGLKPGSEVRAYVGTDPETAVEIGGTESVGGTTFSFQHSSSGQEGYIAIFAMGYNPLIIPRTYAYTDSTLLISQVVDRNYTNPA